MNVEPYDFSDLYGLDLLIEYWNRIHFLISTAGPQIFLL